MSLLVGPSKMSTRVTGGSRGVRLKPKAPLRYASANKQVFMRARIRRFNVSSACLMRRSYKWMGKFGSQLESPAIRWTLNVWIELSDIRDWCRPGRKICYVAPTSLMSFFIRSEHSFSRICRSGCITLSLK